MIFPRGLLDLCPWVRTRVRQVTVKLRLILVLPTERFAGLLAGLSLNVERAAGPSSSPVEPASRGRGSKTLKVVQVTLIPSTNLCLQVSSDSELCPATGPTVLPVLSLPSPSLLSVRG